MTSARLQLKHAVGIMDKRKAKFLSECFSKPNKAAELSGVFLALILPLGI